MVNAAEQLVNLLRERHMTICTAESCTGGLLASMIIDVSGTSDVFDRGFITYANEAKHDLLGIAWDMLDTYGAVSPQVAEQMAQGAAKAAHASVGVGITGIAGPGGGTAEKPVGLVYIGCCLDGKTAVKKCLFSGGRRTVRESAASEAIRFVAECMADM